MGDFDQEWRQSRAGAGDARVDMRLNGTAPVGPLAPGGTGSFGSAPAEKVAAANTIENELEDKTKTSTEHADEATNSAVKGFGGWDTAAGLKKAGEAWDRQVAVLMGRLSSEKDALRGATGQFVRNDIGLGDQFRSIGKSKLHGV
ncbi:hypothetical protein [Streptomyces erythrochromogenes]|uniref:hypothetical protein n=1 Tax=Streptomyces erythrochromogenes TaxID=285574 RepID=UPI00386F79D7|nr:hypothetical protein OG364_00585 [Streptomyces erythrochromogenes]WST98427.1 hypothetical protein OG364_40950 [Streptomyces erythrochromogenes]